MKDNLLCLLLFDIFPCFGGVGFDDFMVLMEHMINNKVEIAEELVDSMDKNIVYQRSINYEYMSRSNPFSRNITCPSYCNNATWDADSSESDDSDYDYPSDFFIEYDSDYYTI